MEKIITKEELRKIILDQFFNKDVEKYEKAMVDGSIDELLKFFQSYYFDYEKVSGIINGARKKVFFENESGERVRLYAKNFIPNVLLKMSQIDMELYTQISDVNSKFKKYFTDNQIKSENLVILMSDLWKKSLAVNKKVGKTAVQFTQETLAFFDLYASIYTVLMSHIGNAKLSDDYTRMVDKIINEKVSENKEIIKKIVNDKSQINAFSDFLDALMDTKKGKDAFSAEEIGKLIYKAPSLVAMATQEKYEIAYKAFQEYLKKVKLKFPSESFDKITVKSIISKSGIMSLARKDNVDFASAMLLGDNVKSIIKASKKPGEKIIGIKNVLRAIFPNLHFVNMDATINKYILTNRITTIPSVSPKSIYGKICDISACLAEGYRRAYGDKSEDLKNIFDKDLASRFKFLKSLGYDFDTMFTKDNLFDLFPSRILEFRKDDNNKVIREYEKCKNDLSENIVQNIEFLAKIVSAEDIQNIMRHNFKFFENSYEDNREKFNKMVLENTSTKSVKERIEDWVNIITKSNKFSISVKDKDEKLKQIRGERTPKIKREKIEIKQIIFDDKVLESLQNPQEFLDLIEKEQLDNILIQGPIEDVPESDKKLLEELDSNWDDDTDISEDEVSQEENQEDDFMKETEYDKVVSKLMYYMDNIERIFKVDLNKEVKRAEQDGETGIRLFDCKRYINGYKKCFNEVLSAPISTDEFKEICDLVLDFDTKMVGYLQEFNTALDIYRDDSLSVYKNHIIHKGREAIERIPELIKKIDENKKRMEEESDGIATVSIDKSILRKKIKSIIETEAKNPQSDYSKDKKAQNTLELYSSIIKQLNDFKTSAQKVMEINGEFLKVYNPLEDLHVIESKQGKKYETEIDEYSEKQSQDEDDKITLRELELEVKSKRLIIEKDLKSILSKMRVIYCSKGSSQEKGKSRLEEIKNNILEKGESPELSSSYYKALAKKIKKLNDEVKELEVKIAQIKEGKSSKVKHKN